MPIFTRVGIVITGRVAAGPTGFVWASVNGEAYYDQLIVDGWVVDSDYTKYSGLSSEDEFKTAVDDLFLEIETVGISKWIAFYLTMLPDATMQSINIIDPTAGTFDVGWTSMTSNDEDGADFSGASSRGNTNIDVTVDTINNDIHVGAWVFEAPDEGTTNQTLIGAKGANNSQLLSQQIRSSSSTAFGSIYDNSGSGGRTSGVSSMLRYQSVSRRSSSDQEQYDQAVSIDSMATSGGARFTRDLHLGTRWQGSNNGNFAGVLFNADITNEGLTTAETVIISDGLDAFYTTLGYTLP